MHDSVLTWGKDCLDRIGPVETCLEIGSHDVNGSLRPFVNMVGARTVTGIDTVAGPGVDHVMDGLDAPTLRSDGFDLVLMTEVLEHAKHWSALLLAAQACVKPGGWLILSTRSPGYKWHGTMYRSRANPGWKPITWDIGDYWRFTVEQMRAAFGSFGWVDVRPDPDPDRPGVFVLARRSRWPSPRFEAIPMEQPTWERTGRSDEWRYGRRYPPNPPNPLHPASGGPNVG